MFLLTKPFSLVMIFVGRKPLEHNELPYSTSNPQKYFNNRYKHVYISFIDVLKSALGITTLDFVLFKD